MTSFLEWVVRFLAWLARRPVLKIAIVEDEPGRQAGGLVFEVENARPALTSLVPTVRSRFWFPEGGWYRKGHGVYDVRELDRELPPFKAKMLTASAGACQPGTALHGSASTSSGHAAGRGPEYEYGAPCWSRWAR